jgi:hypothetical protein
MSGRPLRYGFPGPAATGVLPVSSAIVFQPPQESHLPCQRPNTAPQFWQMEAGAWRDMGFRRSRLPIEERSMPADLSGEAFSTGRACKMMLYVDLTKGHP